MYAIMGANFLEPPMAYDQWQKNPFAAKTNIHAYEVQKCSQAKKTHAKTQEHKILFKYFRIRPNSDAKKRRTSAKKSLSLWYFVTSDIRFIFYLRIYIRRAVLRRWQLQLFEPPWFFAYFTFNALVGFFVHSYKKKICLFACWSQLSSLFAWCGGAMLICFHKFKFLVAIFPCARSAFGDSIILNS